MPLNLIPLANNGVKGALDKMQLAMLKQRKVTAQTVGDKDYYTVTFAVIADGNQYSKSDGEILKEPNLGETFNVRINQENMPSIHGMIPNVRLVNPICHAIYATTSENSTFATINCSISADNVIFPQMNQKSRDQGSR
ncbi:hypothetical protein ODV15_03210 [Lactobacillus amylovorus]|uniref:Uncharacterized protein n=1 Tax=Lactobacillus amylovorus TaxID=1604 RepID=A0A9X3W7G8_LACAM|nr:hypothetical protein [Lactobacillus amylovorus]MDB6261580.1 hypothetical protein [Lactobacillus amylovorus]